MFFKNNSYQLNKFVFYIFLFLIGFNLKAQENLVPNGSFEILSDCPFDAISINKAIGWFSPSNSTPDIYNICSDLSFNNSVPLNGLGYQYAKEGNGYVGIVPYGQGTDYREYISCKLSKQLAANKIYEAAYYVNLATSSPIASSQFGIGFSGDSVHFNTNSLIQANSILVSDTLVLDTTNWIKISFFFESQGNENYIIIGNFSSDLNTKIDTLNIISGKDCYYYLDLVTLTELDFNYENCLTPNGDGVNEIAFKNVNDSDDFKVNIFNRWGEKINTINMKDGWDGTDFNKNLLSDGVYFYQIIFKDKKSFKNGFIHLIR